jgi:hypothetical protein
VCSRHRTQRSRYAISARESDYLACTAESALMRFERWCGLAQVPSDGVLLVLSDVLDGRWFFCAALVGPIASLNASPFLE